MSDEILTNQAKSMTNPPDRLGSSNRARLLKTVHLTGWQMR